MFKEGDHEPGILLIEVVGSGAKKSPEQIGVTALNVGITVGLTVTVYVAGVAHWPALGVNV